MQTSSVFFEAGDVVIGGRNAHYVERGGAGPVAVVLHGFPGNHKVIIDMARQLRGVQLLIPDFPACGKSEPLASSRSLRTYAQWVVQMIEALKISEPIMLMGHSFGARVALELASLHPDLLDGLALITPVVRIDSLVARLGSLEYRAARYMPERLQRPWLANRVYHYLSNKIMLKNANSARYRYLEANDANEARHADPATILDLFGEFSRAPAISQGPAISVPSLVIAAARDEIATPASVQELCGRLPNATLEIIAGAGHLVPAEQPGEVAAVINRWMAEARG